MISAIVLAAALVGTPGMGLAISPAQVVGQPVSSAQFLYKDAGTTTENITVQAVDLHPVMFKGKQAWVPYGEADNATVTPEQFTLHPGQKQVIRVSMNYHDGKTHQIAILATADGHSTVTGGRISASVGARYIVSAPTPKAGLPVGLVGGLAGLCVALLAACGVILRRHRARRSETDNPYGMLP